LVIVDGGKGQLSSAVAELHQLQLNELPVIGLAKQREEVFRPGESDPLVIPHDRGALKLLQRIRDEAHRFANSYNSLLLRRRMRESLLDDCPGMTAGRKVILMKHFGSVAELRRADVSVIARCRGIPRAFAQSLHDWLHRGK
jgi:excinuclease ABC subunit C